MNLIRRVQLKIDYANNGKKQRLQSVLAESIKVVNLYIERLWLLDKMKFVDFKVETWLTARMQQCLGKQASEIVKSAKARQAKGRKTSIPVFSRPVINLDSRFARFDFNTTTSCFDSWITLLSLGENIKLVLPSKQHKHFKQFVDNGWILSKSCRLRQSGSAFYIDVYFEKCVEHKPKKRPKKIGIDCGYKRLLATSTGNIYGDKLEQVYEKLARQQRGSRRYNQTLQHRDNLVGQAVNQCLKQERPDVVVVEALLNVKSKTKQKKRLSTKLANKLQYWVYRKTLDKLQDKCEQKGIYWTDVPSQYTSRICPVCGCNDKASRRGTTFRCTSCGHEDDADINAAVNIRDRGIYSPSGP